MGLRSLGRRVLVQALNADAPVAGPSKAAEPSPPEEPSMEENA